MLNATTVLMRLYLRSTAVTFPLDTLIRDLATPTDAPSAVPLWYETPPVLPYIDLQYGTDQDPVWQVRKLWPRYQDQLHTLWMRYSDSAGRLDRVHLVTTRGLHISYQVQYRFDRVRVEWAEADGTRRGVTRQHLRHPGLYSANNSRLPNPNAPTRYGTRTTPSYGTRATPNQVFAHFHQAAGVLHGESIHPENTHRVVFAYGPHLVRVLHTFRDADGTPYWQDFSLDDWENIDNIPWQDYHNHYCGLA